MSDEIVNRVASSGLITIDLEDYYPQGERLIYDLKDNLWQGLALKEKDFRAFIKEHDWSQYKAKNVGILCSVDAIIPSWAYILLSTALNPYANFVTQGDLEDLEMALWEDAIQKIDLQELKDSRVVIKGCSDEAIPNDVYAQLSSRMLPFVKSLMFGEPCATVPVYKRP